MVGREPWELGGAGGEGAKRPVRIWKAGKRKQKKEKENGADKIIQC